MELKFDPTVASEAQAVQKMLAGLTAPDMLVAAGPVTAAERADLAERFKTAQEHVVVSIENRGAPVDSGVVDVTLTQQQIDTMDETAGLAPASAAPPVPAVPSTAVAAPSPTVPAVPQAGVPTPPSASAPPVPAVPTAPVPPAPATTTSPAPSVELDASGLPWDERIHSSSKNKIADGTWRQRRNLPEGLRESVEAELRAAAPAANPGAAPSVPVPPVPPVPPAALSAMSSVSAAAPASNPVPAAPVAVVPAGAGALDMAAPAASAVPLPPAVTAAAPAPSSVATPTATPHPAGSATASGQPPATNFIELCGKVAKLTGSGELSDADMAGVYQRAGVPSLMALPAMPDQGAAKSVEIDGHIEELFA